MNRFEKKAQEIKEKYADQIISIQKEIEKLKNEQTILYKKCRAEYFASISKEFVFTNIVHWFTFYSDGMWGIRCVYGDQYINLYPQEAVALLEYCEKYGCIPYTSEGLAPFDKWREENSKE